jgi:Holliday junction resolvasome RuvABC endonuclease subunit
VPEVKASERSAQSCSSSQRKPFTVLGLDLSLSATGACLLPSDWNGNWNAIRRETVGYSLPKHANESQLTERLCVISDKIVRIASEHVPGIAVMEMSGWGSGKMAGLHDVVAVALWQRLRVPVCRVAAVSARKLLLGKVPRKPANAARDWVKDYVRAHLTQIGMPEDWSADEADAFVLGQYMLSELGGFAFVMREAA